LKKLMLLAALLAMVVVAAVPAIAQVSQGDFEQETETGEIEQSFEVVNEGNNSNQCAGIQGVANTGTNQNAQPFLQYGNVEPEIEVEETGLFTISPESEVACEQAVNQAAAAN
jgi:hypothetical protein